MLYFLLLRGILDKGDRGLNRNASIWTGAADFCSRVPQFPYTT